MTTELQELANHARNCQIAKDNSEKELTIVTQIAMQSLVTIIASTSHKEAIIVAKNALTHLQGEIESRTRKQREGNRAPPKAPEAPAAPLIPPKAPLPVDDPSTQGRKPRSDKGKPRGSYKARGLF